MDIKASDMAQIGAIAFFAKSVPESFAWPAGAIMLVIAIGLKAMSK